MLKKYLIANLFACCFIVNILAQHVVDDRHYPDSLQQLLQRTTVDTAKADILFLLSDYWSDKDTVKALNYIHATVGLNINSYYKALVHFYLAGIYFEYNTAASQHEYMITEDLLRNNFSKRAYLYRSRLWHNYGALEQMKDNTKDFTDILLNKAIPFAVKAGDSIRVASDYGDVGLVFMNYLDYNKAFEYYTKAISMMQHSGRAYAELADCYTNCAKAHLFNKNYAAARPLLDSAYKILSPNPQSSFLPAYYQVEGMYYNRIKQFNTALTSLDKGILLAQQLNRPYDVVSMLQEKFEIYKAQKNYKEAKRTLLKVYEGQHILPLVKNMRLVLFELAQTDAALNNMRSAYDWLMKYAELSDSLFVERTNTDIAALEAKYASAEKERQILTLQNDKKQQQLTLQQNHFLTTLLTVAFVFVLVVLFVGWGLYRNKQRVAQQQQKLYRQELKEVEQLAQLKVYDAMLQGQEQERNRVARDLHDGLGGMLAGVKLKLSAIAGKEEIKKTDMELYKVITQLDQSVNELRRIARNMMPETLLQLGLEPALKDLCSSLETTGLKIDFEAPGLGSDIPQPVQITIYRIIQELLSNAIRHAQAKNILVQCSQNEAHVFITVEDDGIGFDVNKTAGQNGIGLSNIKSRVEFLKGKFEIHSAPGEGTTVNIEVSTNE